MLPMSMVLIQRLLLLYCVACAVVTRVSEEYKSRQVLTNDGTACRRRCTAVAGVSGTTCDTNQATGKNVFEKAIHGHSLHWTMGTIAFNYWGSHVVRYLA